VHKETVHNTNIHEEIKTLTTMRCEYVLIKMSEIKYIHGTKYWLSYEVTGSLTH
jgi:hypothetical protein